MTTVIDTDALIGLTISTDSHYATAQALYTYLLTHDARIVLLPTTIAEFTVVASSKIAHQLTQRALTTIMQMGELRQIDHTLSQQALALYAKQTSKENSLFDCYIMATAAAEQADTIFSFDRGYTQNGFTLLRVTQ